MTFNFFNLYLFCHCHVLSSNCVMSNSEKPLGDASIKYLCLYMYAICTDLTGLYLYTLSRAHFFG